MDVNKSWAEVLRARRNIVGSMDGITVEEFNKQFKAVECKLSIIARLDHGQFMITFEHKGREYSMLFPKLDKSYTQLLENIKFDEEVDNEYRKDR